MTTAILSVDAFVVSAEAVGKSGEALLVETVPPGMRTVTAEVEALEAVAGIEDTFLASVMASPWLNIAYAVLYDAVYVAEWAEPLKRQSGWMMHEGSPQPSLLLVDLNRNSGF